METESKAGWFDIEKTYYNYLARDYALMEGDSLVYRYYSDKKELNPDKIERAFKDFLYTAGFRLTQNENLRNAGIYVEYLTDRVVTYEKDKDREDRKITGRKGIKTDRTLAFISEICKKNWILSFDGVSHLDNPSFKELAVRLFERICGECEGRKLRMDMILACDPRTGVSFHLMGLTYLMERFPSQTGFFEKIDSPCAFAICGREVSEDSLIYDFCDYSEKELYIYGLTEEMDFVSDLYRIAVMEFKTEIGYALDQFGESYEEVSAEDISPEKLIDSLKDDSDLQDFIKTALFAEESC